MKTVHVSAGGGYDILIQRGQLADCGERIRSAAGGETAALICDGSAEQYYGETVAASLAAAGYRVCRYTMAPGEESKNGQEFLKLLSFCAQANLTRSDVIVALGGGVVGDLAGFVAASYLRGIKFVQIPTTLLSMVDSSVGGKTAIDLPEGKNLAGAFYQPKLVLCDPDTLDTLTPKIVADGLAEAVKYGVLRSPSLFAALQGEYDIEDVIAECVSIKRDMVDEDEHDNGIRQLLNLGHTVGHGIEALSHFGITHGHGVAAGMAIVTRAAEAHGDCPAGTAAAVEAALTANDLPIRTEYTLEALMEAMQHDKKRAGGSITLIIPRRIGECERKKLPMSELADYLRPGM